MKRGGSKRRHNKTKKGGSLLGSAALPIALLGLNTLFSKKSKSTKSLKRFAKSSSRSIRKRI
jgi:hypothetical protein